MKYSQLAFAREYRGLTQTELAQKVEGLSQSNLSKFEKGLGTLSEALIEKIMTVLDFPMSFLDVEINNKVENEEYRKRSLSAKTRFTIKRTIELIAYTFDCMVDMVNIPDFNFTQIDLSEGYTPEDAAKHIRRQHRLGDKPIDNICHLLESNGVAVYEWKCNIESFDGVSLITDNGNRLVVINADMPNDRKRFTLAHELGHIVMHQCVDFLIHPERDKEKEANKFASELLMPTDSLKSTLCGLKVRELALLKQYWKVSMASLIYKAKEIGSIDYPRYTLLNTEISRNGWKKKEPVEVFIDSPSIIKQTYGLIKSELNYDLDDMQKMMSVPKSIVAMLYEKKKLPTLSLKVV